MPIYYKVYPAIAGLIAGVLYLLSTFLVGSTETAAQSKLLIRPTQQLQTVYAGQLDRYIANEIDVLLSSDALAAVAKASGHPQEAISAASTAVQTPGSDAVVLTVKGLGDSEDSKVNSLILSTYQAGQASRAKDANAASLKELTTKMTALNKQIADLSAEISAAVKAAAARSTSAVTDPSVVAPAQFSQRTLLISQYADLQQRVAQLESAQQGSTLSAEVIAAPASIDVAKPLSVFSLAAVVLGGALLGLALALLQVRMRPTVQSWEEIERIMAGRQWYAIDSRVPLGVQMPNPALDSLAVWLTDAGRRQGRVRLGIADFPGRVRVAQLVRKATQKAEETEASSEFELRVVSKGSTAGDVSGVVVPYRAGILRKHELQALVQQMQPTATMFVVGA